MVDCVRVLQWTINKLLHCLFILISFAFRSLYQPSHEADSLSNLQDMVERTAAMAQAAVDASPARAKSMVTNSRPGSMSWQEVGHRVGGRGTALVSVHSFVVLFSDGYGSMDSLIHLVFL